MIDSSHIYFYKIVGFRDQAMCVGISPGEISCSLWALYAIAHVACLALHPQQWWKSCSFHLALEDNQSQQIGLQIKPFLMRNLCEALINRTNTVSLFAHYPGLTNIPAKYWWESTLWSFLSICYWYLCAICVHSLFGLTCLFPDYMHCLS